MSTSTPRFTPETAREFDRFSVANAVTVKKSLPCGCEPYVDVFTYRRWQAQGFQVQRGQKAIKLPLIYKRSETDPKTGERTESRRVGRSAVFCRCQVNPIERQRSLGSSGVQS
jgi:N-terminal domain of anti-restriction factor ArdC